MIFAIDCEEIDFLDQSSNNMILFEKQGCLSISKTLEV